MTKSVEEAKARAKIIFDRIDVKKGVTPEVHQMANLMAITGSPAQCDIPSVEFVKKANLLLEHTPEYNYQPTNLFTEASKPAMDLEANRLLFEVRKAYEKRYGLN